LHIICIGSLGLLSRNCGPNAHLCGIFFQVQISTYFAPGGWAGDQGLDYIPNTASQLPVSAHLLPLPSTPTPLSPRLPNPAAGQNKHGGWDHGAAALGAEPGLSEVGGEGQLPSQGLGGRGAFWGYLGHWDEGLRLRGPQLDKSPG
jgi:hypothetical protein